MKYLIFTLAFLSAAPAFAQSVPKAIDFTRPLKGMDGKPLVVNGLPLTIGSVAANCLVQEPKGSPSLYALAQKIVNAKDAQLTTPELHAIEECVNKLAPLVSGQVDPAIDPNFKFAPVQ